MAKRCGKYSQLYRIIRFLLKWIKRSITFKAHRLKERIKQLFVWYFGFEFLFFCRWNYLKRYINKYVPNNILNTKKTLINHEYMQHVADLSHKYSKLHAEGSKGWVEEWFNNCNIKSIYKDNLIEFLHWSLFLTHEDDHLLDTQEIKWRQDFIDNIVQKIEYETNHKFQKGYNHKVSFIANTKQGPIKSLYHPLIIYIVLYITQRVSDWYYSFILKFEYKWINGLKVWYKLPRNTTKTATKPILLVHGIGIFLLPYIRFIQTILRKNPDQAIICVEIPWITVTLHNYLSNGSSYIKHKLPSETVDYVEIMSELEKLLMQRQNMYHENINNQCIQLEWTLIGHSYGSFICSGIYKYLKINSNISPRLVLIDPVSLCVSHPTTVSLVGKTSSDWGLWILQLFMFQELQISCTLSRYMHWFEYVLYPDDLINDKCKHIICIGTNDKVIPFDIINKGITDINIRCGAQRVKKIIFKNKGHAQWLSSQSCMDEVVNALL